MPSDRAKRMEDALHRILGWCEAYPIETFPEPDMMAIRRVLSDDKISSLHAYWARHLLDGIARHAREGLQCG